MNNRDRINICLFLVFFLLPFFAEAKSGKTISGLLEARFRGSPFSYDTLENEGTVFLSGYVGGGLRFNKIDVLWSLYNHYATLAYPFTPTELFRAYHSLYLETGIRYTFNSWFSLTGMMGGVWNVSRANYLKTDYLRRHEGGIHLSLSGRFLFSRIYCFLVLQGGVDIMFIKDYGAYPVGVFSVEYHVEPFIREFSLFTGVTLSYRTYRHPLITNHQLEIGVSTGITVQLEFPGLKKRFSEYAQVIREKRNSDVTGDTTQRDVTDDSENTDNTDNSEDDIITEREYSDILRSMLIESPQGKVLFITVPLFSGNSTDISFQFYDVIDIIAGVMEQYPDLVISLAGYTVFSGDPALDLERALERAKKIKRAIVSQGISGERILIRASGKILQMSEDEGERVYLDVEIISNAE